VHSSFLKNRSNVFRAMQFDSDAKEPIILDADAATLRAFFYEIYSTRGAAEALTKRNVFGVGRLAHQYEVQSWRAPISCSPKTEPKFHYSFC
jgi:hypothetical protein